MDAQTTSSVHQARARTHTHTHAHAHVWIYHIYKPRLDAAVHVSKMSPLKVSHRNHCLSVAYLLQGHTLIQVQAKH